MSVTHNERIVPDETEPGIVSIHVKRYEFALPFCEGKDVLDAGCGVGYGTALLAGAARSVVGIDRSEEAVMYARRRYARSNVEFLVGDLLAVEQFDESFDVVCAFETIEHLPDRDAFLGHVVRILRRDGVFVVSTPRADETTERPANPFHQVELSQADFEALLRRFFADVELYGQRRLQTRRHRLAQRLDVLGLRRRLTVPRATVRLLGTPPMADVTSEDVVISPQGLDGASELIAVCREPGR